MRDLDRHVEAAARLSRPTPLTLDGPARRSWRRCAPTRTDEDGQPAWVMLQGEVDGSPLMALAQVPLAPSWAPHLDAHLAVDIPFTGATDEAFPARGALDDLRALEDHLTDASAPSDAWSPTRPGRGRRTLHYYVDSARPDRRRRRGRRGGWTRARRGHRSPTPLAGRAPPAHLIGRDPRPAG